jgi:hypothetical protein
MTMEVLRKNPNDLRCRNIGGRDTKHPSCLGTGRTIKNAHYPKSIKVPRDIRNASQGLSRADGILLYPVVTVDRSVTLMQSIVSVSLGQATHWHDQNENRKEDPLHVRSSPWTEPVLFRHLPRNVQQQRIIFISDSPVHTGRRILKWVARIPRTLAIKELIPALFDTGDYLFGIHFSIPFLRKLTHTPCVM